MARFTKERVRLSKQLDQVREGYGCLKGVQASEITDYRDKLTQAELKLSKLQSSLNQYQQEQDMTSSRLLNAESEIGVWAGVELASYPAFTGTRLEEKIYEEMC